MLDSDDLYADLTADVSGFEELMRVRIAVTVGQSCREVERAVLESWLQLKGAEFERFISEICGWGLDPRKEGKGGMVVIPVNKENEAKGTVVRENVQFERKSNPSRRLFVSIPFTNHWQNSRASSEGRMSSRRKCRASSLVKLSVAT